jgi:capsular polysaccharide biosynthesis protein
MENKINDEISLKEIILTIISNWKSIIICIVVSIILVAAYLIGFTNPIYESRISGIINIPETVESKYGIYTFPSTNKMDYINVVTDHEVISKAKEILNLKAGIDGIRSQVTVESETDSNEFTIIVKSNTPENAQILAKTLSDLLIDELSLRYKENAIAAFKRDLDVEGKQLEENLKMNQSLLSFHEENLSKIEPVITLKKLITSNPTLAAEVAKQRGIDITNLSSEVMFEEYINPNYTEFELVVIETKTLINTINASIEKNKNYIDKLEKESQAMQIYKSSGDSSKLQSSTLDIIRSKISIQSSASYSDTPVSPRIMLYVATAVTLGLLFGIFVALFKNYWKTA